MKLKLSGNSAPTTVCVRSYVHSLVTESLALYTSFRVPVQCDNDLLFYLLPSNMTSSHNIDFNGL